ncbi:glucose 1-dehydrogenase [Piscinibacter sakaiensis]|uniref:3-oxoacyl-ACP reductase n=1 Tax=Piscinibacter sakaiensis TaxID=1547922 RepID=A0A0K8P224_PISS1|nr:glucose 1-dehydrogenase [Piscinibacter sakaiensis]GAP36648.1 3-oxoacyl-ACP reductase [Piscinibacter sakaiensis]
MAHRLAGKVAFITGACSGIGLATAELFIEEGARVLAADIQDEVGEDLQKRFEGRLVYANCNVMQPERIKAAIDRAVDAFGGLDIVFNNAGAGGHRGGMDEMTLDGWDRTMDLLLRSVMAGTKYALPHLKARGGGSIVNTSSVAALGSGYAPVAYSVAKAAVLHLSRVTAADLARYRIRVNAVLPGFVATQIYGTRFGMDRHAREEMAALLAARGGKTQPLGRVGTSRDIAEAVLYLASDAAGFVTGTQLVVDGGKTVGTRASWDPTAEGTVQEALGITSEALEALMVQGDALAPHAQGGRAG